MRECGKRIVSANPTVDDLTAFTPLSLDSFE